MRGIKCDSGHSQLSNFSSVPAPHVKRKAFRCMLHYSRSAKCIQHFISQLETILYWPPGKGKMLTVRIRTSACWEHGSRLIPQSVLVSVCLYILYFRSWRMQTQPCCNVCCQSGWLSAEMHRCFLDWGLVSQPVCCQTGCLDVS